MSSTTDRAASVTGRAAGASAPHPLPEICLGGLRVSRLILGSNPCFGFSHQSKDQDERMKAHYTDERIVALLEEAAGHGVSAVAAPPYERWISLWRRYRSDGGKLRYWLAQPDPPAEQMPDTLRAACEAGADAVFIQGERVDEQVQAGRWDVLGKWLGLIRSFGVPAGLASHRPTTHPAAEERGLPTDFYFQCTYQVDSNERYLPEHRSENLAALRKIETKPVIAYKILAAGRVRPREAFEYVFARLRPKDGVCVGVFQPDGEAQLAEHAALTRELSGRAKG